ncbi:hypothetical protein KVR01_006360 [Diaporthe batatas]|uniref:uncharacterized protein n=1 Tax=Diaporthe batatas TaxID=748121 RepID=UPI001D05180F|nr:uncharacterized protein KVR01_006360 [Diaporthe batatas]KAG8164442.1 hypothetical protein KVR01_006360 [Diaporthe batatas]
MTGLRYPRTTLAILSSGSALLFVVLHRYQSSWKASNIPLATHGHENSVAVTKLNTLKRDLYQHRITLEISANRLKPGIENNEILARFTQGFFGGWVFSPERWFFNYTRLSLTNTDKLENIELERSPIQEVWDLSSLSQKSLPPSGSLLFGIFLLSEKLPLKTAGQPGTREPIANTAPGGDGDFVSAEFVAGGSDAYELVSSHRFEVTRENGRKEGKQDIVTVTFSHVSCNSVTGRPYSTFFQWLHNVYARLLFADGIRAVLEAK